MDRPALSSGYLGAFSAGLSSNTLQRYKKYLKLPNI
jgi:hypothetical protein